MKSRNLAMLSEKYEKILLLCYYVNIFLGFLLLRPLSSYSLLIMGVVFTKCGIENDVEIPGLLLKILIVSHLRDYHGFLLVVCGYRVHHISSTVWMCISGWSLIYFQESYQIKIIEHHFFP